MFKILKVEDTDGQYQDKDGNRFNLIYGTYVKGPRANDFKDFETFEEALEYYGLFDPNAPISKPEPINEVSEEGEEENDEEGLQADNSL